MSLGLAPRTFIFLFPPPPPLPHLAQNLKIFLPAFFFFSPKQNLMIFLPAFRCSLLDFWILEPHMHPWAKKVKFAIEKTLCTLSTSNKIWWKQKYAHQHYSSLTILARPERPITDRVLTLLWKYQALPQGCCTLAYILHTSVNQLRTEVCTTAAS